MSGTWKPKIGCRCATCGWKSTRTKAAMHRPCPECGGYPVIPHRGQGRPPRPDRERKMETVRSMWEDGRTYDEIASRVGIARSTACLWCAGFAGSARSATKRRVARRDRPLKGQPAQAPFRKYRVYHTERMRDGRKVSMVTLQHTEVRERRYMSLIRYHGHIKAKRLLTASELVMPKDGDWGNLDPKNLILTDRRGARDLMAEWYRKTPRECAWCGEEFRPTHPRRETCSPACRRALRNAAERERRREASAGDSP